MNKKFAKVAAIVAPVVMGFGAVLASAQVAVPTSTWSSLTANASTQLSDPGTLLVLGGVAGIFLATYFIRFVLSLIPKHHSGKRA